MEAWEVGQPAAPIPARDAPAAERSDRWARIRRRLWLAEATLAPWVVLVSLWEIGAARGWISTALFPPPSQFIAFAVESDFRVGFGREAMLFVNAPEGRSLRLRGVNARVVEPGVVRPGDEIRKLA